VSAGSPENRPAGRFTGPAGRAGPWAPPDLARRTGRDVPVASSRVARPVFPSRWKVRWWTAGPPWHCERVSETAPAEWLPLPVVAERLDLSISKVNQMVRDGSLLAVRRDGTLRVPAELVANRTVRKHLPGVLTLLHDAGFNDEEALRWLYAADETLPGAPAVALGGDRATEVKRRAQALGF
jgi:hypothetical protein